MDNLKWHFQNRRNRRRLLYPAGLLSLILLSPLCICFLSNRKALQTATVMEVIWWSKNSYIDGTGPPFEIHPERLFVNINLTGNVKDDEIKLHFAQLEIRQLTSTKDTTTGIHFHFSDHAKYSTLVSAFNICEIENAKMYVAANNDIWVFNYIERPKAVNERRFICGNSLLSHCVIDDHIVSDENNEIKYVVSTIKTFWLSVILFILITVLAILQLHKL